nr:MAG TPA: hypothetical protein [Caudoviricetes sp.]DAS44993.1 MAG TPA: hypothetical protein [Caudoviricetes sp.]
MDFPDNLLQILNEPLFQPFLLLLLEYRFGLY